MKAAFLKEFLQALLVSLGPPPAAFDWTFTDKDGAYKTFAGMQACRDNRFTFAQTYSHVWETYAHVCVGGWWGLESCPVFER